MALTFANIGRGTWHAARMATIGLVAITSTLFRPEPARAAPGTDAASDTIQEIVVTAQRREQNEQLVPLSVSALSADTLAQTNITSAVDIGKLVPSVIIQQNNAAVTTFVRGIGNAQSAQGNEPSVPVYIDDVYYPRLSSALLRLNNVEQIEVLKGPQGTLFGRNSTGGLIQINTKDPSSSDAAHGDVEVGYGNYKTVNASGYYASPINSNVAADIAVNYYNNSGFGDNLTTGGAANYERTLAVRSKWVLRPSESTKIVLTGDFTNSNSDIGLPGPNPGGPYPGLANMGFPITGGLVPGIPFYDRINDFPEYDQTQNYGGSLRLEQQLGFAEFRTILAYNHVRDNFVQDGDWGPQQYGVLDLSNQFTTNYSAELQLLSKPASPIDWIVGAYYLHVKSAYPPAYLFGPEYGGTLGPPSSAFTGLLIDGETSIASYALYGQTTFNLAPKLKMTLGGRVSKDDAGATGAISAGGYDASVPVAPSTSYSHTDNRFTWRAALDYQVTDNLMTYISNSRGYKAGLYNSLPVSGYYVQPEVLTATEIGIKSEWLERRLRFNGAVFYYDLKNSQQTTIVNNVISLENAPAAVDKGLEFESEAVIAPGLSLKINATWLNAYFTNFPAAPLYAPGPAPGFGGVSVPGGINADGFPLTRAPHFSGNIGLNYTHHVATGEMSLGANLAHTGPYSWTPDNVLREDAHNLLDAHVSYTLDSSAATKTTIRLWGSNLTDVKYALYRIEVAGPMGDVGAPGAPRQYGVAVDVKF